MHVKSNPDAPEIRARQEEINIIIYMLSCLSILKGAEEIIDKRLKAIPGGKRDLRMLMSVMTKLTDSLMNTLPQKKYDTVLDMIPDIRYYIRYRKEVGRQREEPISGIYTKDLDLLCWVAHEYLCKLCDSDCKKCALAQVFDRMIGTDRDDDESYALKGVCEDLIIGGMPISK